jgi:hypothetical protein
MIARAAAALLLAAPLPAAAQSCHDLTGHWQLDAGQSRMGTGLSFNPRYAVTAITLDLRQGPAGVAQDWHYIGPHLDETDRYVTRTDGTLTETGTQSALNTVPQAVRGEWQNCTLVEQGRAGLFGVSVWTTTTFVVAPDDRRLTLLQTSHSDIADAERALVFTRRTEGPNR